MSDKVWIDKQQAVALIDNSEWARMKRPRRGALSWGISEYADPVESKFRQLERKFKIYLQKSLDSFETDNPDAVQQSENGKRYEEGALRKFLEYALNGELYDEFGSIPSVKV